MFGKFYLKESEPLGSAWLNYAVSFSTCKSVSSFVLQFKILFNTCSRPM